MVQTSIFKGRKLSNRLADTWILGPRALVFRHGFCENIHIPGTVLLDCGPLDLGPLNQITESSFLHRVQNFAILLLSHYNLAHFLIELERLSEKFPTYTSGAKESSAFSSTTLNRFALSTSSSKPDCIAKLSLHLVTDSILKDSSHASSIALLLLRQHY